MQGNGEGSLNWINDSPETWIEFPAPSLVQSRLCHRILTVTTQLVNEKNKTDLNSKTKVY